MSGKTAATMLMVALGTSGAAYATEYGQTHVDLAYIDTLSGYNLPPGLYLRDDINVNTSSRLNDQNGNRVRSVNLGVLGSAPFKYRTTSVADVFSAIYIPGVTVPFLNATLGMGVYGFYAGSRAEGQETVFGRTSGSGETRRGLGDITFVPAYFQWTIPRAHMYAILSPLEFTAPTGQYNRTDPIGNNLGLNYWSYRPALELTYLNATGQEVSANINLSFNSKNTATSYQSGDEFSFTYVVQQHLSPKFALGAEGYFYDQFTNDKVNGAVVNTVRSPSPFVPFDPLNQGPGNRGQVFGIGPTISYSPTSHISTNFHWVHEVFSYDRRQGEAFWVRAAYKF